ncbi:MAG: HdeD family acid-resistance protein [Gammaproteobacteria bacterium]
MNIQSKFENFGRFGTDWRRLLFRGSIMLCIGVLLAAAALFKPDVMMFSTREFSWLPVAGFVVLTVGILECFDAFIARELRDFFLNLQNGVFDVVVAALIIFSIGDDPARLSLMIASFLMVKGIIRIILTHATQLPHKTSTLIGACASVLLGFLIWVEWPTSAAWFLAVCLSSDIGFRGWSLMMFAFWVKMQGKRESAS